MTCDDVFLSPPIPHFYLCRHIASPGETMNIIRKTRKRAKHTKRSLICQHKAQSCYKLDGISMGAPVAAPTASSLDVERPTTTSIPELHGTPHTIISSGWLAGCPEESYTKAQKPHDATFIFMYTRALITSLWKTWKATKFFPQIKAAEIWRMRTNTMANQEYRPHLPEQFPRINLHVAECPQKWIFLIHLQSLFPSCPWCPPSYLLRLLLRSNHILLQLPPMLSSRTPLPPWRPQSNRGQVANFGLHCFRKHPHQLPVLACHWLRSHQMGMWARPLPPLYSIFPKMNDVANELLHDGLTFFS